MYREINAVACTEVRSRSLFRVRSRIIRFGVLRVRVPRIGLRVGIVGIGVCRVRVGISRVVGVSGVGISGVIRVSRVIGISGIKVSGVGIFIVGISGVRVGITIIGVCGVFGNFGV